MKDNVFFDAAMKFWSCNGFKCPEEFSYAENAIVKHHNADIKLENHLLSAAVKSLYENGFNSKSKFLSNNIEMLGCISSPKYSSEIAESPNDKVKQFGKFPDMLWNTIRRIGQKDEHIGIFSCNRISTRKKMMLESTKFKTCSTQDEDVNKNVISLINVKVDGIQEDIEERRWIQCNASSVDETTKKVIEKLTWHNKSRILKLVKTRWKKVQELTFLNRRRINLKSSAKERSEWNKLVEPLKVNGC